MANEEINVTPAELDALGSKLDSSDLTEKDKQIIGAAFALAGEALSSQDEVSGFAYRGPAAFGAAATRAPLGQGLSSGFQNSLAKGSPSANFNNAAVVISIGF